MDALEPGWNYCEACSEPEIEVDDECAEPLTFERARWLVQMAVESLVTIPPQGFRWESIRDGFASEMVGEVEDFARVQELAVATLNEFLRVERVERSGGAS